MRKKSLIVLLALSFLVVGCGDSISDSLTKIAKDVKEDKKTWKEAHAEK